MLGLPSLTIKSGPFPSTIIILVSWLYVISSIIIVAELCFDSMEEHGLEEVSFTSLATNTLGSGFGAFVVVVYSTLCFSLLVACVAGIGSIFSPWFPRAILIGGVIPLVMVLSWNLIVLGLVGTNNTKATSSDPISLLLSVNPSALSSVQGFAFSAMATSLIGYALSLPKQLLDTLELVFGKAKVLVTLSLLGFSVLIASFFQSTFSRALDFAGVYANCFLFGIIPPVMAYMQQSKKKIRYVKVLIVPHNNI
uniref:Tyrosine-specific transport protein n=1 Tax=Cajanus cajan TaxID=3821 RepID=A0A151R0N3_CAJCA|nr:hypothetical protein KK1_042775 [Cajanus cajan]